jgi:hypothetical protein
MGAIAQIDRAAIEAFLAADAATWTALMKAGEEAVEYWKSEAPVGDKEHTLPGGYVERPGDYKNSIRHKMIHEGPKRFIRVQAFDFKANWIENGSVHNRALAPCAKTRAYMLGRGFKPGD